MSHTRLSPEQFLAIALPIIERGQGWPEIAAATGLTYKAVEHRARALGLRSGRPAGRPKGTVRPEEIERLVRAARAFNTPERIASLRPHPDVPLPGGKCHPLYRKLRRAGIPRDAAIAECLR